MYATHPAIHHQTDWLRAALAALLSVALAIILVVAVNLPQTVVVTPVAPAQPMTMSEMQQQVFGVDHHADIYGTPAQQLQRVFVIEHQADMLP